MQNMEKTQIEEVDTNTGNEGIGPSTMVEMYNQNGEYITQPEALREKKREEEDLVYQHKH